MLTSYFKHISLILIFATSKIIYNFKLNPIQWHINMLTHKEVCVNPYTTHSPPKGMCPLGIETILSNL
jgi:hypothetical protein